MKKLETSKIAAGSKAPISNRSLAHIQEADRETIDSTIKALVDEQLDNATGYSGVLILHGAVLTDNGTDIDITSGAVYYQGEIYRVDAQTATPISNSPAWKIKVTYRTGDPVEFSDGVSKDFHAIEKMEIVDSSEASTIENYSASKRFLKVNANQLEDSIFNGNITALGSNIGINNGSPGEALDIVGGIKLTGLIVDNSNNIDIDDGTGDFVLSSINEIRLNFDSNDDGTGSLNILSGGSSVFLISNSGAVSITGNLNMNANNINNLDTITAPAGENIDIQSEESIILNYDSDSNGTGGLLFYRGGSEIARFDQAGNFGMSLTTPEALFHINGGLYIEAQGSAANDGLAILSSGGTAHQGGSYQTNQPGFVNGNAGTFAWKTSTSFTGGTSREVKMGWVEADAPNTFLTEWTIDDQGGLDINGSGISGVSSIENNSGPVTIKGNVDLNGNEINSVNTISNTGNIILGYDSDNSGSGDLYIISGGSTVAVFNNAGGLDLNNNGLTVGALTTSGNVSLGGDIDMNNQSVVNIASISSSSGGSVTLTSDDAFEINVDADGAGFGSFLVKDNGTNKFLVTSDIQAFARLRPSSDNVYDLGASSFAWSTIYYYNLSNVSDKRFKENIHHTELGLEFINKLNPVEYNFKGEEKVKLGFLAQDVQEIISSSFGIVNDKDPERLGLNYTELIAPMVKAIQELSAEVQALKNK